jgi:transposase-like protein
MDAERKGLRWVKQYGQVGSYSVAALKCGISPPTLRKWVRRYEEDGVAGLASPEPATEELAGEENG